MKTKQTIDGDLILTTGNLKMLSKKDLVVTIKSTKISVDDKTLEITDGESTELEFTVIRRRPQVESSVGIASFLKPLTFNAYSIYQDGNDYKIGNTESTKILIPTLFLNYYVAASESFTLILPQIGIGTGKEYPTILAGIGGAIPGKFFLSVGIAGSTNQHLKSKHSLNSVVTLEEAQNLRDLYYLKWEIRPYASLQIKF